MDISKIKSSSLRGFSSEALGKKGGLLEKKYRLKDLLDLKTTHFHYWRQRNLLESIEDSKKTSLNLVECVWIKILISLKNFGCSGKTMEWVHQSLFLDAYTDKLNEIITKENIEFFKRLGETRPLTVDEQRNLDVLIHSSNDKLLNEYFRKEISYLYNMILDVLERNADAGIIITEDGKCKRYKNFPGSIAIANSEINIEPHIRIPIAKYLREFITQDQVTESLNQTGVLSDDEYRLIKEMRNNNIRSLKIHFRYADHAIEKLEIEEKGLLSEKKSRKVMELLGMKNYNSVELNTRDGQRISFTRTGKKLL